MRKGLFCVKVSTRSAHSFLAARELSVANGLSESEGKSPNQIALIGTFMTLFCDGRLVAGAGFEPTTSGL